MTFNWINYAKHAFGRVQSWFDVVDWYDYFTNNKLFL